MVSTLAAGLQGRAYKLIRTCFLPAQYAAIAAVAASGELSCVKLHTGKTEVEYPMLYAECVTCVVNQSTVRVDITPPPPSPPLGHIAQ